MLDVIFDNWGEKVYYVTNLLAPLAFLPLLAPESLILAIPWILASFSTNYQPYYSVYFQYTGFVFPFIIFALPTAIERLKLQKPKRMLYVVFLSIINRFFLGKTLTDVGCISQSLSVNFDSKQCCYEE